MTARTCQAGVVLGPCDQRATRTVQRAGTELRLCAAHVETFAGLGWSPVPLGRRPVDAPWVVRLTVRLTAGEMADLELVSGLRGQTAREVARDAIVAATRAPTES